MITRSFGLYQTNPLNINPLRDAIDALIDFDRVRACTDVEIFISATNVWTGKVAIFRRQELTADHLMASACLPTVFQAGGNRRCALLGRRLYGQSGPVPALLRVDDRRHPARADQPAGAPADARSPKRCATSGAPAGAPEPCAGNCSETAANPRDSSVLPRRHLGRACATARQPADRGRSPIQGAGPRLRRRGTAGGPPLPPRLRRSRPRSGRRADTCIAAIVAVSGCQFRCGTTQIEPAGDDR